MYCAQQGAFIQAETLAPEQAFFQQALHPLRPGNQGIHLGKLMLCQRLPACRSGEIRLKIIEQALDLRYSKASLLR